MKKILFIVFTLFPAQLKAQSNCFTVPETCNETDCAFDYCGPFVLSSGIYRIPFVDGTSVTINCDHFSHCPRGRIDMVSDGPTDHIAAAADGWIRAIVDNNTLQACECSNPGCHNNYVWIEHPNGEWSKYTHFETGSVMSLGHYIGEWVTAGTYLGKEGAVGCASGVHLHFEIAQPVDTNTLVFSADGGFIDDDWAKNVIPVICGISGNVFTKGSSYTASDCSSTCTSSYSNSNNTFDIGDYDVDVAGSYILSGPAVTLNPYSSVLYQANDYIKLLVGFEAKTNSTLTARIGGCNEFPERMTEPSPSSEDIHPLIYPNPSGGIFQFEVPDWGVNAHLMITDVCGRTIKEEKILQNKTIVNLSGFSSGLYFYKLFIAGKMVAGTMIIGE